MAASSRRHGSVPPTLYAVLGALAFRGCIALGCVGLGFAGSGCTGHVGTSPTGDPGSGGAGVGPGTGGSGVVSGTGGSDVGPGTAGSGAGGASVTGTGGTVSCPTAAPGRAPLRRLTTFEFNNTVRDLLLDTTPPSDWFPSETLGNGFGNDADSQSVSSLLANGYLAAAEELAARATLNATALGRLNSCASAVTTANEESCARTIITNLLPRAYRRTVTTAEVDD